MPRSRGSWPVACVDIVLPAVGRIGEQAGGGRADGRRGVAAGGTGEIVGGEARAARRSAGRQARARLAPRVALLIAAAAGGLQEARGGEAEGDAAGDDSPRLAAPEVLEVAQDRVAVLVLEV